MQLFVDVFIPNVCLPFYKEYNGPERQGAFMSRVFIHYTMEEENSDYTFQNETRL